MVGLVQNYDKERKWLSPEVNKATIQESMENLERVLEFKPHSSTAQCLSVRFNKSSCGFACNGSEDIISLTFIEMMKAHEELCKSSVSLDGIFDEVCDRRTQSESSTS